MQEGVLDEGHITRGGKKQRAQSPAASSSPVSMPDTWQLLAIKGIFHGADVWGIFDCRCTPPISEARFGILDKFPILEVSPFPSANNHPYTCPLVITPYIQIYGLGVIHS